MVEPTTVDSGAAGGTSVDASESDEALVASENWHDCSSWPSADSVTVAVSSPSSPVESSVPSCSLVSSVSSPLSWSVSEGGNRATATGGGSRNSPNTPPLAPICLSAAHTPSPAGSAG